MGTKSDGVQRGWCTIGIDTDITLDVIPDVTVTSIRSSW